MPFNLRWPDRQAWVLAGIVSLAFFAGSAFGYRLALQDVATGIVNVAK